MAGPRLQFNLGTVRLAIALIAVMGLLVHLGEWAAFMALFCAQLGIFAIVYGRM
jgi:hypothetical protein